MIGHNRLLVAQDDGHGVSTMERTYAAWIKGAKPEDIERIKHPIRRMVEEGLRVTLSSDDPPMFKTDIGREFAVTCTAMEFSPDTASQLALNGVDASWLDEGERRVLRATFEQEIAELRSVLTT